MLSVWLYGYALGITSERRIEQRRVEDLGFRYLAGGAGVDNGALSRFRRRHGRGINDVFTSGRSYAVRSGGGKKLVVGTTANRAGGEWRCEKQSGQKHVHVNRVSGSHAHTSGLRSVAGLEWACPLRSSDNLP
jgi:hypothetical protein